MAVPFSMNHQHTQTPPSFAHSRISRSTLQRRLREEGTSYQAVLDVMRRDMAIRYLTKTTLRADEIASVLAYRDANSFSRSFRRWTGLSPLAFRQVDNRPSASGESE
ncbi:helix-turn-helix domain-containing protein [Roseovarius sp. MS2]|uniref:helix-turn-helix domain-containing protein n=1 Tax=Roseovarius sp. MS2 TaxID=3390728 RepID=UPI003EDC04C1